MNRALAYFSNGKENISLLTDDKFSCSHVHFEFISNLVNVQRKSIYLLLLLSNPRFLLLSLLLLARHTLACARRCATCEPVFSSRP
jgi:hypothetical protein